MKKLLLVIAGLVVIGIVVYAYQAPSIAFHNMEATIAANDIDTFSTEVDADTILKHLRNQMSLQMQDALRAYPTRPDLATTEAHLALYFDTRSAALATPASLLRELGSQLKGQSGKLEVKFRSLSTARINWISNGQSHEVMLSRQGIFWKLSALDFSDVMPRFWDQPTELLGVYHQGHFANCCVNGEASETPYNQLQLGAAIDILDVDPDSDSGTDWVTSNVTEVQIGADEQKFAGIKDGDLIEVGCKALWQGKTGHYALPVYCESSSVLNESKPLVTTLQPSPMPAPTTDSGSGKTETVDTFNKSSVNPGFNTYINGKFGFRIDYPEQLVVRKEASASNGITLASTDGEVALIVEGDNSSRLTLKEYYDRSINAVHGTLGYRKIGGNWFVISWTDNGKISYTKTFLGPGAANTFTFTFPEILKSQYSPVVDSMAKSFRAGNIDYPR